MGLKKHFLSVLLIVCMSESVLAILTEVDFIFEMLSPARISDLKKYLAKVPGSVHSLDQDGRTPLHALVQLAQDQIMRFREDQFFEKMNICENAARLIDLLLQNGLNINDASGQNKATALHYAVRIPGAEPLVKFLITNGADPNAKDRYANRPLHYALLGINNNFQNIDLLLQKGARPLSPNNKGQTSLHLAAWMNKPLEFEYLLQNLPNPVAQYIDVRNNQGITPLMYAVTEPNNDQIIRALIKYGADINVKDVFGDYVFDYAVGVPDNISLLNMLLDREEIGKFAEQAKTMHAAEIAQNVQEQLETLRSPSPDFSRVQTGPMGRAIATLPKPIPIVKK